MAMIMVGGPWCTYFAYCRRWWYGTAQYGTVRYGTVGDLRFKEIVIIDMCRLSTKKNDYFRVPVVRVIYVTICIKLSLSLLVSSPT